MTINVEDLNDWLKTDEGKQWEQGLTAGLRTTNGNLKGEKGELETKLAEQKRLTDELQGKLDEAAANGGQVDADAQAEIDALKTKLATAQGQSGTLQKQLINQKLATSINSAIIAEGGNPAMLGLHVRTRIATEVDENGNVTEYALDAKGNKLYDENGKAAGIEHIVKAMKGDDSFKAAFTVQNKPGSGGRPNGKQPQQTKGFAEMSGKELGELDTDALSAHLFKD